MRLAGADHAMVRLISRLPGPLSPAAGAAGTSHLAAMHIGTMGQRRKVFARACCRAYAPRMDSAPPASPLAASPCTGVCRIAPATGLCAGCARTLDEIAAWFGADNAGKRAILARVEKRLASDEAAG